LLNFDPTGIAIGWSQAQYAPTRRAGTRNQWQNRCHRPEARQEAGLIRLSLFDHIVLTTRDLQGCIRFYRDVLGMQLERFATPQGERLALKFGNQKINVHEWGKEFTPRAHVAVPGSLDLCFIAALPLEDVIAKLEAAAVPILEGPVIKTGATSKIRSVYVRDPDLNLVEISVPARPDAA
jgi:catechol 2,3-dioxygenase-like lactoylglutathione lyase family enzyme